MLVVLPISVAYTFIQGVHVKQSDSAFILFFTVSLLGANINCKACIFSAAVSQDNTSVFVDKKPDSDIHSPVVLFADGSIPHAVPDCRGLLLPTRGATIFRDLVRRGVILSALRVLGSGVCLAGV
eukprot:Gregarina_sp_Poly_1__4091@NODE_2244_length_2417_cov_257_955319_g1440_i0_p2_GENE_NODE_2244_length_2417_cov_257_955319_g1440_i0NODE_2244_length_2417_cov_257_955319_g1440_i0_p2_ORF_typecomplete_len125_score10_84_NODE_2244_length_2417_cov_257_955319_g1440_i0168542